MRHCSQGLPAVLKLNMRFLTRLISAISARFAKQLTVPLSKIYSQKPQPLQKTKEGLQCVVCISIVTRGPDTHVELMLMLMVSLITLCS